MGNKKVGIWIRVSTEEQGQGESPEHHEKRARLYAEMKGWEVVEVYNLLGISGKSVKDSPETKRMLRDIEQKKITGLVFSKLARLSRDLKQLNEFAEYFQKHEADLISLDEALDTSTPAGRMLYNIIGTFAQFEREEIADRVAKSVPIRAKLGKPLGGEAPFGYRWEDKELILDENEAPVRKLIYTLFLEHKRKRTVATALNEKGYRTRRGGKFTDTTIDRLLKDPIAKGMRRANYTKSTGEGKGWQLKSKEDWVFTEAPRIVSDEIWDACNDLLEKMSASRTKPNRKTVHLFTTVLECSCGGKMYMRTRSPKYVCYNCNNKIAPDDLEEIYHSQLETFLFSEKEIQEYLETERKEIESKKQLVTIAENEIKTLKKKVTNVLDLYDEGAINKATFSERYNPLAELIEQKENELLETQSYVDALSIQSLTNDEVLHEARSLHKYWPKLSRDDKRNIIEAITSKITIGEKDITINLHYLPTATTEETPLVLKSLQKSNEPMSLRLL